TFHHRSVAAGPMVGTVPFAPAGRPSDPTPGHERGGWWTGAGINKEVCQMSTSSSSSLSRLVDDWPGWDRFLEGRVAHEVMHLPDVDGIRVEEVHEDGAVVVRAGLPGVDPDTDIEVTVTAGALEIRAHREQREEEREEGRYRTEFRYGSFL